ncbi:winged helix-turn-helix domain-containing protein [Halococcus sediminicola]|uniref:winged helix-turn-helix domain-containing protein n=1 Tax=Halococcus sediminicola TaxID=1264579 RepID=UPI00067998AD|nr:winged helix-turn-helix domain-containing protein [Halococcus sediminicola]
MVDNVQQLIIAGTYSYPVRIRILRALNEHSRNARQLAEDLDLDRETTDHHLEIFMNNGIVRCSSDEFGTLYRLSDQIRVQDWSERFSYEFATE